MNIKCSKRCTVRMISFLLAGFLVLFGFWMRERYHLTLLNRQINHQYQAALDELSAGVDNISVSLKKCKYASTPAGFSALVSRLSLETGNAEAALAALPIKGDGAAYLAKFISQVGDYCLYLSKKAATEGGVSPEEMEKLYKLSAAADNLSTKLEEARTVYNSFESWDKVISDSFKESPKISDFESALGDMKDALIDSPTLIYDGPFSDHLTDKKPELLKNKADVSKEMAKKIAASALRFKDSELTAWNNEEGNMPSYIFGFSGGSIGVTQKGGYITYFRKYREITSRKLSYKTAIEKAKDYINSLGLGEFKESYYMTDEGVCTVNFAYLLEDTVCYTDLIKVGVALDTGEIMLYEARGFISNHYERELPTPKKTEKEARAVIKSDLNPDKGRLVYIPSGGQNELLCYEFHIISEAGEELLIYINADTLYEEQLSVVLKTDGGTLTR